MSSRRQDDFRDTVKTVFYAVLVALLIRTFAYEPFNIPSRSMVPTLMVGDYLFVYKPSYGFSKHSFPMSLMPFSGRIFASEPERGDVAVFKLPADNSTDYIKRVIGLPGDRIQMKQGRLYINDEMVERRLSGEFVYRDKIGNIRRLRQYTEVLPGGLEHTILEESDADYADNTREFTVPAGHYFMMGDNRDHSADSRGPVGFVPFENFVGRAEFFFFSTDGSARIWEVWKWFGAMRFSRFFQPVE